MNPHRIGLTGGIGSGKSTVAEMFAELGVPVLDLDRVGQTVVQAGSPGLKKLVEVFGADILNQDGSLNRKALGKYCFTDAERTVKLNAVMHPLIWQAEEDWLRQQQGDYAVIEASVLLESGGVNRMDAVIVVLADVALRRQRVLCRGRQSEAEFEAVVRRQCDDAERRRVGDYVIDNSSSLEALQQQVQKIHTALQRRFRH
ncbi:MAG: dephospho-CoA kinase [Mariprofundus sp.]